jgi:hypothetical protein
MARTVLNPYQLPGDYAGVGVEVIDSNSAVYGGVFYTHMTSNSMYQNYRSTLVHDGKVSDTGAAVPSSLAPVLYSTTQTAKYKPRIMGRSSLTERVQVWCYINFRETAAATSTISCLAVGGSTATYSVSGTTTGWVQLQVAGQDLQVDDSAETQEFEVSFTNDGGTWEYTRVEVVHIFHAVSSTALEAVDATDDSYDISGFFPFDTTQIAGELPRSTVQLYQLHTNLDYLDKNRVGNICGAGNMSPDASTQHGDTIFSGVVPENVVSAKFWVDTASAATTTVTLLDNSGDSSSAATSSGTWTAITVDVNPGEAYTILITTDNTTTGGRIDGRHSAHSQVQAIAD